MCEQPERSMHTLEYCLITHRNYYTYSDVEIWHTLVFVVVTADTRLCFSLVVP